MLPKMFLEAFSCCQNASQISLVLPKMTSEALSCCQNGFQIFVMMPKMTPEAFPCCQNDPQISFMLPKMIPEALSCCQNSFQISVWHSLHNDPFGWRELLRYMHISIVPNVGRWGWISTWRITTGTECWLVMR